MYCKYKFIGVFSLFFLISNLNGNAQDVWSPLQLADSSNQINSINSGFIQSSGIQNSFVNKFLWGGFIEDDLKQKSLDIHKSPFNYLEAQANLGISYQSALQKNWFWGLNYNYAQNNYAKYTTDLFHLIFKGNENLEKADLQNIQFFNLGLNQAGFSIGKQIKNNASLIQFLFNPYLNLANQFNQFDINGILNTSNLGDEINFTGNIKQYQLTKQGIGAGLNFSVFYQKNKNLWRLDLKNLGFVKIQTDETQNKNQITTFTGVEIVDIFAFENAQPNLDNFTDTLIQTKSLTKNIITPFSVQLSNDYLISNNHSIRLSGRYFNAPNYLPQFSLGYTYQKSILQAGFNFSLGGYTSIMAGTYLGANFNNFKIGIASNNILAWFMPQNTQSQALFLQLKYSFK